VVLTLGGTAIRTATSDANGAYAFVVDAGGSYSVTPSRNEPAAAQPGVTTLDISLVRRHILNVSPLNTPYKLLAGDVNASGSISTIDISHMRRLVLASTNTLPGGAWRFVPSDYVFTTPQTPWSAPANRTYAAIAAPATAQDFVAVKLGDVNADWGALAGVAGLAGDPPDTAALALELGEACLETPGTDATVVLPLTVAGFTNITSVQFTLAWDPSALEFVEGTDLGLPGLATGNLGTTHLAEGRLTFSWDDPNAMGMTLPAQTVVCRLRFRVLPGAGASTPVAFVDVPTPREASANFERIPLDTTSGRVVVGPCGAAVPARLSIELGDSGIVLCLEGSPGARYALQTSSDLGPEGIWTVLSQVQLTGTNRVCTPATPPEGQHRFYRAVNLE
jgi:hypothetical protein